MHIVREFEILFPPEKEGCGLSAEKRNNEEAVRAHHTEERSHHEHHHSEHHHGEHRHSEHHHRRKKTKKKNPISLPKFMKQKKFWINMGIVLGAVILLTGVALLASHGQQKAHISAETGQSAGKQWAEGFVNISVTYFDKAVSLVGEPVTELMEAEAQKPVGEVLKPYRDGERRLDVSYPVILDYDINGLPSGCAVTGATVEVSETEDFRKPLVFEQEHHARSLKIYNLKTDTQYFYRVNIRLSNEKTMGVQGSFQTAKSPRILTVEGAVNVRDLGGWKNGNGETIRQGMIYRGSELDGAIEPEYKLTSAGMETMLQTLGIRKDLDLRPASDNSYGIDALGAGVEHIYFDMPMYTGIFSDQGKTQMKKICSELAKESSYPVYIHCTYGLDRTGTVCALLEALLGVGKDDILRDYRLSGLYHRSVPQDNLEQLFAQMETYPGYNLQEKTENFLLSAGVTKEEIAEIRRIMLK